MQGTATQRSPAKVNVRPQRPWALLELGVGVVSRTTADAALEIAYGRGTPIMLIASRRQIDARSLGGGYVEGWSTEQLADYVHRRDPLGMVILCRDHGGPWQGRGESQETLCEAIAMERAKASFLVDIEAGFELLHIDSSRCITGPTCLSESLRLTGELSSYCHFEALKRGKNVEFEIGLEEQVPGTADAHEFEGTTEATLAMFSDRGLPRPRFVVAQTGTKVEEMRNVGELNRNPLDPATIIKLQALASAARRLGVQIKAHNSDYLSDSRLAILRGAGILTLNVAPEFGVTETKSMLELLAITGLKEYHEAFVQRAIESNQWRKWMAQESIASELERALISGHYIFNIPEVRAYKKSVMAACYRLGVDGEGYLRMAVKRSILRYLTF